MLFSAYCYTAYFRDTNTDTDINRVTVYTSYSSTASVNSFSVKINTKSSYNNCPASLQGTGLAATHLGHLYKRHDLLRVLLQLRLFLQLRRYHLVVREALVGLQPANKC